MTLSISPKTKSAADIRALRAEHSALRDRDFAQILDISEAELVAAFISEGTTRLSGEIPDMLAALPSLGEVMALTRNESAVHEKIGVYEKAHNSAHAFIFLGEQIDLRIFPKLWAHCFAVEKTTKEGEQRRSLQFFNASGEAVHKVHMRPASNLEAYNEFVARFTSPDQAEGVAVTKAPEKSAPQATDCRPEDLREAWSKMTDTHQFFGMLKKLKLSRLQAMHMIDSEYAWRLDFSSVVQMFADAAEIELPIMVFVGNEGCIQIHSGPITGTKKMGPWLNIMDPTFHLHLRQDHIHELWAVRKPTADGHVSSIEAYDADGELIIQFFGKRQEGNDERPQWREIVESLPQLSRASAA